MSISFLFGGLAVTVRTSLEKWVKWTFIGSFVLTVLLLIVILVAMGLDREYFFEIAAYTVTWLTLIVNGILLFKLFQKELR
jgi:hypothetical protein